MGLVCVASSGPLWLDVRQLNLAVALYAFLKLSPACNLNGRLHDPDIVVRRVSRPSSCRNTVYGLYISTQNIKIIPSSPDLPNRCIQQPQQPLSYSHQAEVSQPALKTQDPIHEVPLKINPPTLSRLPYLLKTLTCLALCCYIPALRHGSDQVC